MICEVGFQTLRYNILKNWVRGYFFPCWVARFQIPAIQQTLWQFRRLLLLLNLLFFWLFDDVCSHVTKSVWEILNCWVTTTRLSSTWLSKHVIRCFSFLCCFFLKSIPSRWSDAIFFRILHACFRARYCDTKWDILWLNNTSYVLLRKFKNRRNNILAQSLDISIQKRFSFQFE